MDQTYAFSLDGVLAEAAGVSMIDSSCINDYIAVPGEYKNLISNDIVL